MTDRQLPNPLKEYTEWPLAGRRAVSSLGSFNTEQAQGSVGGPASSIAWRTISGYLLFYSYLVGIPPEGSIQDCVASESEFGSSLFSKYNPSDIFGKLVICSSIRTYINGYVEGGIYYWSLVNGQTRWIQVYKSTSILPGRLALFPNDTLLITAVDASSPDFGSGAAAAAGIYRTDIRRRGYDASSHCRRAKDMGG